MPSKLRKAISVVKDQTSISLAKVSSTNRSNLDVAVLKATTHEEAIEDRYVNEVLVLTSSSPQCATACVHALARRISRTKNWIVALKSLALVFKILQQGDPHFAQEAFHAMKRGATLLNLSNFRDDSNSSPWDYTAFVRTYALYVEERLGCCLMSKLHGGRLHRSRERILDMEPDVLLDRIPYWQRLLDRVLATRPAGSARSNRLVQISVFFVVQESFHLYRDIFDGLAVLLENFHQLQHQACIEAANICIKASRQFDKLAEFYTLSKGLGVGRQSEYPSVKKISERALETLEEFLMDDADSPHWNKSTAERQFPLGREPPIRGLDRPNQNMEEKRKLESQMHSPDEDFWDGNETIGSKSSQGDQEGYKDLLVMDDAADKSSSSSGGSEDNIQNLDPVLLDNQQLQRQRQLKTLSFSTKDVKEQGNSSPDIVLFEEIKNHQQVSENNNSCMDLVLFNDNPQPLHQQYPAADAKEANSGLDLALFDDGQSLLQQQQQQLKPISTSPVFSTAEEGCWEMVLAETASDANEVNHGTEGCDQSRLDEWQNYQNPFLQGGGESYAFPMHSMESLPPPTFNAKNPDQASTLPPEADPFSSLYCVASPTGAQISVTTIKSPLALHQQDQWLEQ